ncbi:MAG TPA: thymidine phosphorylase [Vicinamibacterales bacterium]|nr:thymidine phosphorylase [Vicinamibacterales bacterium]
MTAVDIIRKKRDSHSLDDEEIRSFVAGVTDGSWSDYQATALLMAIYLRGMDGRETATLTDAMVDSGLRLDLAEFGGVPVDKHSTGGVGDKTSIVIAPAAAACGAIVPMMSGRGLGHTGGTLDKLESIPGFRTQLSIPEMKGVLRRTGCALIGQTAEIAPADRTLYALRDVTGTVESLPLICSSIMSKKIAEGVGGLVLDVKTGRGAFLGDRDRARALAAAMVETGTRAGVKTEALLTAMDAPLGRAVGNALEIAECIDVLKGGGPPDLVDLCELLAARMLVLAGVDEGEASARARVHGALQDGSALERFRTIIEAQGGNPRVLDDGSLLPAARARHVVKAPRAGFVTAIHADLVGRAAVLLGAGRARLDSVVDPAVGIVLVRRPGDEVKAGDAILEVHYNDGARLAPADALAREAIEIDDAPPPGAPLVLERLSE